MVDLVEEVKNFSQSPESRGISHFTWARCGEAGGGKRALEAESALYEVRGIRERLAVQEGEESALEALRALRALRDCAMARDRS